MDYRNVLVLLAFIINLLLSSILYVRATKNKVNGLFEITALGITFWCFAMFFYRAADATTVTFWAKMLYFFPTFIPSSFFLFGLYFPNKKIDLRVLIPVAIINLIMASFVWFDNAVIQDVIISKGSENKIIFGWAYYYLYSIYIPFFFTASYFVLFRKLFKEGPFIRMQVLYILLGMSAASIPAMITNLNLPTFGYFELNWIGQVFTVFWVSGVAYAIIRHRLMDIRLVVAKTLAYTLLIIVLGLVYGIGLFVIGGFFFDSSTSGQDLVISTVLALFMAFSYQPLLRFFEKITNAIFFKNRYDSQFLLGRLSHIMASTLDLSSLASLFLQELLQQMKISGGSVVITREDTVLWSKEEGQTLALSSTFKEKELPHFISWLIKRKGENILVFDELEESNEKVILRAHNISVILALVVKDELIGALLLREKASGDIYSIQDIELLKIIAPEVAVAVKNALSYEEIKRFNITLEEEVNKATVDLQSANDRLKELDTLKDEFVSLASHELRTPMTVIKSYIWLLLDGKQGPINDKQKMYLERTFGSVERLINLVNDMLNVSRIESGRMLIEKENVDITQLVKTTLDELRAKADELQLHLEIDIKKENVLSVNADPDKIKQVLLNLIGNSLKFTPAGGTITVILDEKDSLVEISVVDTGQGINKEDIEKLFKKFGMIGKNYLSKQGTQGTGLGLYLTKSIVELHGGTISVVSEGEGKGTTFSFTLPKVLKTLH
jgi:signal transduction histidine kinase